MCLKRFIQIFGLLLNYVTLLYIWCLMIHIIVYNIITIASNGCFDIKSFHQFMNRILLQNAVVWASVLFVTENHYTFAKNITRRKTEYLYTVYTYNDVSVTKIIALTVGLYFWCITFCYEWTKSEFNIWKWKYSFRPGNLIFKPRRKSCWWTWTLIIVYYRSLPSTWLWNSFTSISQKLK